MIRPREIIDWNRRGIHTRLRIESAEARNSYDRTAGRGGRKRRPLVQLRTTNQILAQSHVIRRAGARNQEGAEAQSPWQPHGSAQKETIADIERRAAIVLHEIRWIRWKSVRAGGVAVRIVQHVVSE